MGRKSQVVTGKVRLSYVNIFNARRFQEGQEAKYSLTILIDKKDKATLNKIKKAIEEAKQKGKTEKWGGKIPGNLWIPLRDGDDERAEEAPEYEGMMFMNCKNSRKPGIVDENCNEILDATEVYSGCYGRVGLDFFAFNSNGNKGIGVSLNTVQKLEDGECLGGAMADAESDFGDDDDDMLD